MKIPLSVRNIYSEQKTNYEQLKGIVDELIKGRIKKDNWHYQSRIKSIESFALKVETGRVSNPSRMEDYFACMLVVENIFAIEEAEKIILQTFDLKERRPKSECLTHKNSDAFPFDDLRLYIKWKDDQSSRPTGLHGYLFEIQIKTFLQHAWSIATHDLIYKSDSANWATERLAYQIKAMIEHAETSILEAEKLSSSKALNKTNKKTSELLKVFEFINDFWEKEQLPDNLIVLARNIHSLLRGLKIDIEKLRKILSQETEAGKGSKTLNLSPYGIIIQSLINCETKMIENYLTSEAQHWKIKIAIPSEIELPDTYNPAEFNNAIII
ncbi:hypothetical protein ACFL43_01830 [Thermodesulfobacteriota bacterium]